MDEGSWSQRVPERLWNWKRLCRLWAQPESDSEHILTVRLEKPFGLDANLVLVVRPGFGGNLVRNRTDLSVGAGLRYTHSLRSVL